MFKDVKLSLACELYKNSPWKDLAFEPWFADSMVN